MACNTSCDWDVFTSTPSSSTKVSGRQPLRGGGRAEGSRPAGGDLAASADVAGGAGGLPRRGALSITPSVDVRGSDGNSSALGSHTHRQEDVAVIVRSRLRLAALVGCVLAARLPAAEPPAPLPPGALVPAPSL